MGGLVKGALGVGAYLCFIVAVLFTAFPGMNTFVDSLYVMNAMSLFETLAWVGFFAQLLIIGLIMLSDMGKSVAGEIVSAFNTFEFKLAQLMQWLIIVVMSMIVMDHGFATALILSQVAGYVLYFACKLKRART